MSVVLLLGKKCLFNKKQLIFFSISSCLPQKEKTNPTRCLQYGPPHIYQASRAEQSSIFMGKIE